MFMTNEPLFRPLLLALSAAAPAACSGPAPVTNESVSASAEPSVSAEGSAIS